MRVSSYTDDDGIFVAGSSRAASGYLWKAQRSEGLKSRVMADRLTRGAKPNNLKKKRTETRFFASREQMRRNTGGLDGKSVLLAKRLQGGCAILSNALETTHSFRKQPLQGANCAP